MIDKVFHHIAFTLFWGLVIAVVITTIMRWVQYDNQMVADCVDKGYPEAICRGV